MLDAEDVGNITAVGNVLKSDSNKKIELLIELGKLQMAVENTESESRVKGICNVITSKFAKFAPVASSIAHVAALLGYVL